MNKNVLNLRFIIIGDSPVGKTSLLIRYVREQFSENLIPNIFFDYQIKKFEYKGFKINLCIFEYTRQEKERVNIKTIFKGMDGFFIVFDLTNQYSFNSLKSWIDEIKECKGNDYSNIVILGNKSDLEDIYHVSDEDIENFKKEFNIDIIKTSAKNGNGVKDAFNKMIDLNFSNQTEEEIYKNFCRSLKLRLSINKKKHIKNFESCVWLK